MRNKEPKMRGRAALSVAVAILFAAAAFAVVISAADADDDHGQMFTGPALGAGGDILEKRNFGGGDYEFFYDVAKVTNGYVAVGYSSAASIGTGDWATAQTVFSPKGNTDAIIVMFDNDGEVSWAYNFGGSGGDAFYGVAVIPGRNSSDGDTFFAVGYSDATSFTDGDWLNSNGITGNGGTDAILVAFNESGGVIGMLSFGGTGNDVFEDVAVSPEGEVYAVGYSDATSFGNGDWAGVTGYGGYDAIMVRFTEQGVDDAWNFGGAGDDMFFGVAVHPGRPGESGDTIFAVGYSAYASFGNGDWAGVTGYDGEDAIIVGYDPNGLIGALNFGGSGNDVFNAVAVSSKGDVFAVGYSTYASFGNGDWAGAAGYGGEDAIIALYRDGALVEAMNFGGTGDDWFEDAVVSPYGDVFAVGVSDAFGNGDWTGATGFGGTDAIAVGFRDGEVMGALNYGGAANDAFYGVTVLPDGNIVAAGYSEGPSFGTGDWTDVAGKGGLDATLMLVDTDSQRPGGGNGGGNNNLILIVAAASLICVAGFAVYFFVLRKH